MLNSNKLPRALGSYLQLFSGSAVHLERGWEWQRLGWLFGNTMPPRHTHTHTHFSRKAQTLPAISPVAERTLQ